MLVLELPFLAGLKGVALRSRVVDAFSGLQSKHPDLAASTAGACMSVLAGRVQRHVRLVSLRLHIIYGNLHCKSDLSA